MSLTFTAPLRSNRPKRNVNFIGAGNSFSIALQKNGRAWGWGYNSNGQVGDNSIINKISPVSVLGAVKTFCVISASNLHSLAIDKNGRVWAWGNNGNGRLGDNTTTSRRTPVSILGGVKTFCKISAANFHSLAIDKNGRAWSWGYNLQGQLGDNSITQRNTPVSVLGAVKTFCEIAGSAGGNFSLAIDKYGRAWAWGQGNQGQLGNNSATASFRTPISVLGAVKTFCQISAGVSHGLVIDKNGRAWGWGGNGYGQIGDNSTATRFTPVSIAGTVKTFCKIAAGHSYSLAIDKNGRAWGWGLNTNGQLGDNSITQRNTPVSVLGAVKTFCQIKAGVNHSVAVDKNGRAWAWGNKTFGQLGDNLNLYCGTPVSVLGAVKTFCSISAGGGYSLAIDKNGRAWAWGFNNQGQLGDSTNTRRLTPVSVLGAVKTFCKIDAGQTHSLAIDKNGRLWGWGSNTVGEVGDNAVTNRFTPVSVLGAVKTFCTISAGNRFSLAIDKNNRLWGWGYNTSGQLGDNSIISKRTPVSVLGAVKTFCKIDAGGNHSLAIDKNGRLWSWGNNANGRIGDNSTVNKLTPVSVLGAVKTFCDINAGLLHSLAIDKNGRAWAWGANINGQLGDNSITSRLTPVSVLGGVKTFCQIKAGGDYSLALDKNGRLWSWGNNNLGQLGDNTTTSRLTPVSVLGAAKTFCQITANSHSLAIDQYNRAWGWGYLLYGRLGINEDVDVRTPVRVCNI